MYEVGQHGTVGGCNRCCGRSLLLEVVGGCDSTAHNCLLILTIVIIFTGNMLNGIFAGCFDYRLFRVERAGVACSSSNWHDRISLW